MIEIMLETVDEIRQIKLGCWSAIVTFRESPSKMKEDNPKEIARGVARRAVVRSLTN